MTVTAVTLSSSNMMGSLRSNIATASYVNSDQWGGIDRFTGDFADNSAIDIITESSYTPSYDDGKGYISTPYSSAYLWRSWMQFNPDWPVGESLVSASLKLTVAGAHGKFHACSTTVKTKPAIGSLGALLGESWGYGVPAGLSLVIPLNSACLAQMKRLVPMQFGIVSDYDMQNVSPWGSSGDRFRASLDSYVLQTLEIVTQVGAPSYSFKPRFRALPIGV